MRCSHNKVLSPIRFGSKSLIRFRPIPGFPVSVSLKSVCCAYSPILIPLRGIPGKIEERKHWSGSSPDAWYGFHTEFDSERNDPLSAHCSCHPLTEWQVMRDRS